MMKRFQTLLSVSSCAATTRTDVSQLFAVPASGNQALLSHYATTATAIGRAVQVGSIKTRVVESAHGFNA